MYTDELLPVIQGEQYGPSFGGHNNYNNASWPILVPHQCNINNLTCKITMLTRDYNFFACQNDNAVCRHKQITCERYYVIR